MNCIVSGTFDPITVGHVDIIKRASKMFDLVYVLVAKTSSKSNSVLTYENKVEIIENCLQGIKHIILPIENTLIDTIETLDARTVVRGLRNATDLIYEMDMSSVNRDLCPEIETVYLPCRPELSYVSSSMVRELCRLGKYQEAKKYCSDLAVNLIHRKQMKLVALTGGIACGKSEVQKIFEANGWVGYDLDEISNEVLSENSWEIIEQLNEDYGKSFSIDDTYRDFKQKLAKLVFSNASAKKWLESVMHPLILEKLNERIYSQSTDKVVVQVPLLFEAKLECMFDKTVCVLSSEKTQIERMVKNRSMTEEDARARIASQLPTAFKSANSDFTLNNDGSIEELDLNTRKLLEALG